MQFGKKQILNIVSVIILLAAPAVYAGITDDVKAVKISGGEGHTLVIVKENSSVFACGPNGDAAQGYYGVLGTGSSSFDLVEEIFVRVHAGDMNTLSGYLENIDDIAGGWMHSLALDVNDNVWAWGNSQFGQFCNYKIFLYFYLIFA